MKLANIVKKIWIFDDSPCNTDSNLAPIIQEMLSLTCEEVYFVQPNIFISIEGVECLLQVGNSTVNFKEAYNDDLF